MIATREETKRSKEITVMIDTIMVKINSDFNSLINTAN